MSPFDIKALEQLLESFGDNTNLNCLEIGSWYGAGSTQIIAKYSKSLICIDHWMGNSNGEHSEILKSNNVFNRFEQNVSKFGDVVIPMKGDSSIVLETLKYGQFDFIFIDADHRYAATLSDIQKTKKLLKPGGILCGHDCEGRLSESNKDEVYLNSNLDHCPSIFEKFSEYHPGVVRAVYEEIKQPKLFADKQFELDGKKGYSSIWWTQATEVKI